MEMLGKIMASFQQVQIRTGRARGWAAARISTLGGYSERSAYLVSNSLISEKERVYDLISNMARPYLRTSKTRFALVTLRLFELHAIRNFIQPKFAILGASQLTSKSTQPLLSIERSM